MAKKIGILAVILLSFWTVTPFFANGFFPMHDDTQVVRVDQMAKALTDGHFPVRWVKDLGYGYGYPIFNFYAPLPYYVGGFVELFGFDALMSTKIMMLAGILLAGIFMYLLAREFWGEVGGLISVLFYMYAPYHAVDIYVRGAVGEFWAYAFLPLLAFGLYKSSKYNPPAGGQSTKSGIILGALGFAGVVLSHNLTALMLMPFLIIVLLFYCFIAVKKKKPLLINLRPWRGSPLAASSLIIVLGLGLSAFYWIPAILELSFTNVQSQIGGGADFRDHFVCWQQLWDSRWGFGGSTAGCDLDGLSLKIGKLHVFTSFVALVIAAAYWKKNRFQSKIAFLAGGFLLIAAFLTLEASKPIWETITPLAFLQYPWRFLLLISFFSSFLAGAVVWFLNKNSLIYFGTALILLSLLFYSNTKLFQPESIIPKTVKDYTNEQNVKWTTSKISDEYMPQDFAKPMDEVDTVKRRVQIGVIKADKTQELVFVTNEKEPRAVLVSIAPFPAWQVFIDNVATSFIPRNNGIELAVPQGEHMVRISYVSTWTELLGNTVSMISIAVLISVILLSKAGHMTRFLKW